MTQLSRMNPASVSTILCGDSSRLNLLTDKDLQLWTETEHDLLRLICETHITISLPPFIMLGEERFKSTKDYIFCTLNVKQNKAEHHWPPLVCSNAVAARSGGLIDRPWLSPRWCPEVHLAPNRFNGIDLPDGGSRSTSITVRSTQ